MRARDYPGSGEMSNLGGVGRIKKAALLSKTAKEPHVLRTLFLLEAIIYCTLPQNPTASLDPWSALKISQYKDMRWGFKAVEERLAKGNIAGDGQNQDTTLVNNKRHPSRVIKASHHHPPHIIVLSRFTVTSNDDRIIVKIGCLPQEKTNL